MGILFDVGPSETRSISQECHRLCFSGLSLVDPATAGGQRVVNVWAEAEGCEAYAIGTLSEEEPIVALPPVVFGVESFFLRHDSVAATVRFYGTVLDPPPPSDGEEEEAVLDDGEEGEAVLDDGEEEMADEEAGVEYELLSEEDIAERYDSDNGEDEDGEEEDRPRKFRDGEAEGESSKRNSIPLVAAPAGSVVPEGEFLGTARFAIVENTAGFMRVAAAEGGEGQGGNEILVLYRYTRFSRTWSGRRGVEECRRTKLHWLRFAVPAAGDLASSLAWAGASLSPLIYPRLFRRQLQDLWSRLTVPAMVSSIPSRTARLQVIVDVGILRCEDHTPERMEHMFGALEGKVHEAWPEYYHVCKELHLPEPVRHEEGRDEDGARLANWKRVAEECSVCLELLERGLAAWPGCMHVFHGACLEKTLAESEMCPLCRGKLSEIIKMHHQSAALTSDRVM
ncbi:uncharacterized protein LOC133894999 [Phragmites australis]|uniref:uncharacterized protein LOC133894999 n=1 Tax=Phragmites australis TaxID=29695 RepID=UPI002D79A0E7|nr:uncharacterized protein LOC133894999 [Phragmites australis]